jgi:hypothetical protein
LFYPFTGTRIGCFWQGIAKQEGHEHCAASISCRWG